MSNVYRFSVSKTNSDKLVDMTAVEEVVRLSKEAEMLGKQLEAEITAQNADSAQDGLKMFIRSQIEASMSDGLTRHVQIVDEDTLADLIIEKGLEHVEVKCEYRLGKENWQFCKDLGVLYVNSDQTDIEAVKERAMAFGVKKIENTLSKAVQCEELTNLMQVESKITGNPAAIFFPHAYNKAQAIKLIQINGAVSAKAWAKVGGAVAIGSNVVSVLTGEKTVKQAAKDMATSAAKEILIDYAKSQVIRTAVGQPIVNAAMKYGGKTLLQTLGKTGTSATGLAINTIGQIGTATAGLASQVGLTGTAGVITTGTAGLTGLISAGAALVTPLAPAVAAYGAYKLFKKIF